jgi:hypothetical protein
MGRGPNWHPPRHLAAVRRSRTDAREHLVAEWLLAAVAIVLTTAVVIGQMIGHRGRPEPGPAATAPPPGTRPATGQPATGPPAAPTPPATAAALAGWRAIGGVRVERPATAPDRPGAAGFTTTGGTDQGMALAAVARCTRGRTYAATIRLRASRPNTVVQVTLLEVADGRRFAADTVGAVLVDRRWQRVEVAHQAHRPGTALALEVVLPRGSPPATVLVDDVRMAAGHP